MDFSWLQNNVWRIIQILRIITKIDDSLWEYSNGWSEFEGVTQQYQLAIELEIPTNDMTISKMDSWLKLLDYDNTETFKTMFNELMEQYHGGFSIYMIKVGNPFTIGEQGYLRQESIFDDVLGGGVLYTIQYGDEIDRPRTFCNDTVCCQGDI